MSLAHSQLFGAGLTAAAALPAPTDKRGWAALLNRLQSDQAVGGLAESLVAGRLEALSAIDPRLGFVLVYSSPQYAVASALDGRAAVAGEAARIVAGWLACNDELLRFYNRHSARCVLVDVESVVDSPSSFIEHVAQTFSLSLNAAASKDLPRDEDSATQAISARLAKALVEGHRDAATLHIELASQASLDPAGQAAKSAQLAWDQYVALIAARDRQRQELLQAQAALIDQQARTEGEVRRADEQAALAREQQAALARAQAGASALKQAQIDREAAARAQEAKLGQLTALAAERDAQLRAAKAEHEQVSASAKLCQSRAAELAQQLATLRAEQARHPDPARLQSSLDESTQENELLLVQLNQVQEELERHYLKLRELEAGSRGDAPMLAFLLAHWADSQASERVIDLRHAVVGSNWHHIEDDGRWAGPGLVSTLQFPALRPGHYSIQLHIVDAMQPEILLGMELSLNGVRVETEVLFDGYPALVLGNVLVATGDRPLWQLEMRFAKVVSPSERGGEDERQLAVRLRSATLAWLEPA
ncbi:MAG: hypothetical protein ABI699_14345 [Caldimonas sp.]